LHLVGYIKEFICNDARSYDYKKVIREVYKSESYNLKDERPVGRPTHRWNHNIEIDEDLDLLFSWHRVELF